MSRSYPIKFLLILGLFVLFLFVFLFRVKDDMKDFEVNYNAGKRLSYGETLYRTDNGHYTFKYFPSAAFLYLPLSFLPLDIAKATWYFLIIFCSCTLFYISTEMLPQKHRSSYLMVFPVLVLAKFLFREINLGQINALVTLVLLLMIRTIASPKKREATQREILVGILWGLATALKPYALIFFPYFIVKKKWKALLSGIGFISLALFAPSLYYGIKGNTIVIKEWIITFSQSTPSLLTSGDNISIMAFFMKWTGNQSVSFILSGMMFTLLSLLILIAIFKGKEMVRASVLEGSILLILIPLVSPLGWDYTLLLSALGITIIIHNFLKFSKIWRIMLIINFFIIAFSIYDIMGRKYYEMFMSWSVLTINFLIIIGYLSYLRVKQVF